MTCVEVVSTEPRALFASALLTVLVGGVSWLAKTIVSAVLWYHAKLTREIEMVVALRAEIETADGSLGPYATDEASQHFRAGLAKSPDFKIFAPLDRDYFIFDTIKPNISQLPEGPIREVVKFYDGIGGFDGLLASFQEPRFESFPPDRRATYVDHMVAAAKGIRSDAKAAMSALTSARHALLWQRNISVAAVFVSAFLAVLLIWKVLTWSIDACGLSV